ncbi:hypothetical protein L202_06830 [Cryptococcus amylolentus CBS 6039]|uniref:Uncharacterized protein n=2 Tax=Cryptococcus amylolentus TaxID=104669 RepID=A0A1E3HDM7_9TREE|nr:hypothetical protein L202_06830 [Cryptococcus amylolentus CBS 6039]ODN74437.1 hypothetical protein L202_06830 [Cryptococcus amylolentus CBS 6039]ODO01436.1 hypothetical protein I350_06255 [Cryptococcus amylolentus CBS 6273]
MTMRPDGIYDTPPCPMKADPKCTNPTDIACRLSTNACSGLCHIHSSSGDCIATIATRTSFLTKHRVLAKERLSAFMSASRNARHRQPYLLDEKLDDYVMVDITGAQSFTTPLDAYHETMASHNAFVGESGNLGAVYESDLEEDGGSAEDTLICSYVEHLEPTTPNTWTPELPDLGSDDEAVYPQSVHADESAKYDEDSSSIHTQESSSDETSELRQIATQLPFIEERGDPICPDWLIPLIDYSPISSGRSRLPALVSPSSCEYSDDDEPPLSPTDISGDSPRTMDIVQRRYRTLKRRNGVRIAFR